MKRNTTLRLIPTLIMLAFSSTASAAGFQLQEQNASGLGNAYAGSAAVAENASTIFFNPAGMTQLQDRELSVGLSVVRPSFKFTDNGSVPPPVGAASLSGNGGDAGSIAYLPNAYMSWALNKDLYAGLGLGAPFGLVTEYDNAWLGAGQSIKFEIKTYNINPSIAYRVNERMSVGAGISAMFMDAEYVKRTPVPGFLNVTRQNPFATLKADDWGFGWNIGALFQLTPATKLGLSYRSQIKQKLDGDLTVTSGATVVTQFDAKADVKLPDTAIISLTHKLNDRLELLSDVSWTGWSSIPNVDIKRSADGATVQRSADGATVQRLDTAFKNTWRVALGSIYKLNDTTKLKFGVAYDETPVPDAERRLVSLPDNDRLWLSTGVQWKPSKAATVDLGAAYLYVSDTQINNNGGTNIGLVRGEYDSNVWILGAQYSYAF